MKLNLTIYSTPETEENCNTGCNIYESVSLNLFATTLYFSFAERNTSQLIMAATLVYGVNMTRPGISFDERLESKKKIVARSGSNELRWLACGVIRAKKLRPAWRIEYSVIESPLGSKILHLFIRDETFVKL